jgi:general secretion pathway protein D
MPRLIARLCLLLQLAAGLAGCSVPPWQDEGRPAPLEPPAGAEAPVTVRPQPQTIQPLQIEPYPRSTVEPVIERGTGVLAGEPQDGRSRASISTAETGEVTLNVVDADLREVVRLVLEDTLGLNYVIDPGIQGTITVQTSRPVPADELLAVLDAVLRLNGAALVSSGDFYRIVPIDQALTSGLMPDIRPVPDAGTPGFTVRVVPLRYVSASQVAEVLAPLAPPGGTIQVDPSRNLLLIAGSADQIATLSDLIATFDVDWLEGMSIGLYPLQYADPERLAAELDAIFGGTEEGPLAGVIRLIPVDRLNAVLVVTSQPGYLDRAAMWIKRLDQSEGDEEQVYVYSVQNGRAADLAEVLSQLFDLESAAVGQESLLAPGMEPVEIPSSGSAFGEEGGFGEEGEEDLESEPAFGEREPRRQAARLEPSRGEPSLFSPDRDEDDEEEDTARIIADENTNSLVIRATPRDFRRIEAALEQLDILPLQVLIEATIAEVTLRDELRYGVEWFFRFGGQQALLDLGQLGIDPAVPAFSAVFTSADDVRMIISALESVTDVNVISSPQLMVLDNQTAQLQVGDEVPIITQQAQGTDEDSRILNSVEQRQTGVILNVTPRVNASGLVTMEIEQEVSDVVPTTTSAIDSPTIRQRRVASTVAVASGETVALGGLIQDSVDRNQAGVPFLGRIPVIGWLFGQRANVSERTELLVLITPRSVGSQSEARAVTEELQRRLRGLEDLQQQIR